MEFEIITYTFATYLVIFLIAYFLRKKFTLKENENIETTNVNEEINTRTSNKKRHYVIVSLIVINTIALTFFGLYVGSFIIMMTPLFLIILSLIFKLTKLHGSFFNDLYEATKILLTLIMVVLIGAGACTGIFFIGSIGT